MLADLEKVDITISRAKSQFCYAGIKIVGYSYNFERWHLDTSKVLKIFNWLKYVDITIAQVFIDVYVYYQI